MSIGKHLLSYAFGEKTKDEIYGPNETVQLAEQFGG